MNPPSTPTARAPSRTRGFTLVEILVAMVIGMIGMIIMLQVFATAEGQKRATTGTGDAQTSGAMAIYDLQRDIRQSGYGFNSLSLLNCTLNLGYPTPLPAFAPAFINPRKADGSLLLPAGDANTDSLLVISGDAGGSPEGDAITLVAGAQVALQNRANYADNLNHWAIAGPATATAGCALALGRASAAGLPNPRVNLTAGGASVGGLLFDLGLNPSFRAYAIRGGNLTACDYLVNDCSIAGNAGNAAIWVPIAENVVSLRLQYGRDTSVPMNGVDTWDRTTPTTPCDWVRVSALRLAVVARNGQPDRDPLTLVAPTWEGSANAPIDLGARANWQNYRYRVFETVVPIRNLPWMARC